MGAIHWLIAEMQCRYIRFSEIGARGLEDYNRKMSENTDKKLPSIVAVVDDVFQILSNQYDSVEEELCNLILKGNLVGIHLVLSTQYVYSGAIVKLVNLCNAGRISFALPGRYDSIAFLGKEGAEQLSGKGEMLYLSIGGRTVQRVQGCYASDEEIERVANHVKANYYCQNDFSAEEIVAVKTVPAKIIDNKYDELLELAMEYVIESEKASVGMLQRRLRIGFNRAARLMDQMEEIGFVGPFEGAKPRVILGNSIEPYLSKIEKSKECLEIEREQIIAVSSMAKEDQIIQKEENKDEDSIPSSDFEEIIEELPPIVISSETLEHLSNKKLKKRGTLKSFLEDVFSSK